MPEPEQVATQAGPSLGLDTAPVLLLKNCPSALVVGCRRQPLAMAAILYSGNYRPFFFNQWMAGTPAEKNILRSSPAGDAEHLRSSHVLHAPTPRCTRVHGLKDFTLAGQGRNRYPCNFIPPLKHLRGENYPPHLLSWGASFPESLRVPDSARPEWSAFHSFSTPGADLASRGVPLAVVSCPNWRARVSRIGTPGLAAILRVSPFTQSATFRLEPSRKNVDKKLSGCT